MDTTFLNVIWSTWETSLQQEFISLEVFDWRLDIGGLETWNDRPQPLAIDQREYAQQLLRQLNSFLQSAGSDTVHLTDGRGFY